MLSSRRIHRIRGARAMARSFSLGSTFKHRSLIVALGLPLVGLILIVLAQTFRFEWYKIEVDRCLAEIGALLFIVSVLHWFFELGLRDQMLREVASTVTGSSVLYDCGLDICVMNSRDTDEHLHWSRCANLIVGNQYSTRFLKDFHQVIRDRSTSNLPTKILVLSADCPAAKYLEMTGSGTGKVATSIAETRTLLTEFDKGVDRSTQLIFHDRIFRYSFIQTDEYLWVTLYTNSSGRAYVPQFKIRAGTPLYKFFDDDIKLLLEQANATRKPS